MSSEIEVIIIEDHLAVRKGLELLLRAEGLRVAGVGGSLSEARHLLARRRHDVVLLDISLPDGSGVALVRERLEYDPASAFVIHTGATDAPSLDAASRAGARGFVLKSCAPADLLRAIREVAGGGSYIDPGLAHLLSTRPHTSRLSALSRREREILNLLADGLSGEDVAERLVISRETVRTHVRNAMTKLDAHTRAHAVALIVGERPY